MPDEKVSKLMGVALRVGVYVLFVLGGLFVFAGLLTAVGGYLVASAVGVFPDCRGRQRAGDENL